MHKKPASPTRLKQAIIRSVASSTAIETRRSVGVIEKKLQGQLLKPVRTKRAG